MMMAGLRCGSPISMPSNCLSRADPMHAESWSLSSSRAMSLVLMSTAHGTGLLRSAALMAICADEMSPAGLVKVGELLAAIVKGPRSHSA